MHARTTGCRTSCGTEGLAAAAATCMPAEWKPADPYPCPQTSTVVTLPGCHYLLPVLDFPKSKAKPTIKENYGKNWELLATKFLKRHVLLYKAKYVKYALGAWCVLRVVVCGAALPARRGEVIDSRHWHQEPGARSQETLDWLAGKSRCALFGLVALRRRRERSEEKGRFRVTPPPEP
jgi:hypothetical protein